MNKMSNPIIDIDGSKFWYNKEGEYHRLDGPAIEWANGSKEWWVNNKRHRLDGPAIEYAHRKEWWVNGERHRLDGPAIEYPDGHKYWYINGEELTEEEFNRQRPIELQPVVNRFLALMDEI